MEKYNRESFINILASHFGKVSREKETNRVIKFGTYHLNEIANILDYTPSQITRRLNPNEEKEYKEETYKETIIRTQFAIKARNAERKNNEIIRRLQAAQEKEKDEPTREKAYKMVILFLILLLASMLLYQYFHKPEPIIKEKIVMEAEKEGECLLSDAQREAIISWHMISIQRAIAIEGLILNLNIRDSVYTRKDALESAISETQKIIIKSQEAIRRANLVVNNGQNLAEIFVKTSRIDLVPDHFEALLPTLENGKLGYQGIIKKVMSETEKAQNLSKIKLDSIINEMKLLN